MPYELSPDPSQPLAGTSLKLEAVEFTQSAQVWCAGLCFGLSSDWKKDSFSFPVLLKILETNFGQGPVLPISNAERMNSACLVVLFSVMNCSGAGTCSLCLYKAQLLTS